MEGMQHSTEFKKDLARQKQILRAIQRNPSEEDYGEILHSLESNWPRTVQLEALKALTVNPHPNAPIKIMQIVSEENHPLCSDLIEEIAKKDNLTIAKFAETFDLLPSHAKNSIAYFLGMNKTDSEHSLMKKVLKDEDKEVRDKANGKTLNRMDHFRKELKK